MKEEFEGDEKYMACVRRVEELSTDPNFIGYYDIEEARRQELEDMKDTGIRIGKEEGIKVRNIEIAKVMLNDNLSADIISKYTNLSIDEIQKISIK